VFALLPPHGGRSITPGSDREVVLVEADKQSVSSVRLLQTKPTREPTAQQESSASSYLVGLCEGSDMKYKVIEIALCATLSACTNNHVVLSLNSWMPQTTDYSNKKDCDDCRFFEDASYEDQMVETTWSENKTEVFTFKAPKTSQACKFFFTGREDREADVSSAYSAIFEQNSSQKPPRFYAYQVVLHATGSHNPADRWGSRAKIQNIRMRLISDHASNVVRLALHCDMPLH
jgi:hypothetical protein